MKKILITIFIFGTILATLINVYRGERACAGSKCHFNMSCLGNANIKATVCTTDCSSSSTQQKVISAFKKQMKCSSPSTPTSSNSHGGWKNCDIVVK